MKLWPRLGGDRRAREKWEVGLAWFRLRYHEPAGPTRCLKLLSRTAGCGRIALYHQPEVISRLYLGVPETHMRLLQRMAGDFGLLLKPLPPEAALPPIRRLALVSELPWNKPFVCQIVREALYAGLVDEDNPRGAYLPEPPVQLQMIEWQLPTIPPTGLTAAPTWNGHTPPAQLIDAKHAPQSWLLGRSRTGQPLQVPGRVNIYGGQQAVADWLTRQVTQMMAIDPANLVIIDGAGDLVSQLKRKTAVTRLLGEQLAYIDIDNASLTGGFNPLAAVPGEGEEALVGRWQRWFQGMNVHPQGVDLLARARQEGVEDIPGLRKWLKKAVRKGQVTADSSLILALSRLTANRAVREWLEWPTNRFDILPAGALFFSCKGSSWDRYQLLRSVLLAALAVPEARLIVHGFPWRVQNKESLQQHERMIIGNGPRLPGSTIILVACSSHAASVLSTRFLGSDQVLAENLQLLQRGDSMIFSGEDTLFTTWWGETRRR